MTLEERFREECTIVDGVGIIDAQQCVSITDENAKNFARMLLRRFLDVDILSEGTEARLELDYAEYKRINDL